MEPFNHPWKPAVSRRNDADDAARVLADPRRNTPTREERAMAAHADHHSPESIAGAGLLPVFAIAVVIATIAICVVIAAPSTVALIVALGSVIGFGAGIVALLSRLIGPEEH
jgi:hypothetical protein